MFFPYLVGEKTITLVVYKIIYDMIYDTLVRAFKGAITVRSYLGFLHVHVHVRAWA